jgi:hypothetical protein
LISRRSETGIGDRQAKSLGPNHPNLAQVLDSHASLLEQTQRKSEASTLKVRGHTILKKNSASRSSSPTLRAQDLGVERRTLKE